MIFFIEIMISKHFQELSQSLIFINFKNINIYNCDNSLRSLKISISMKKNHDLNFDCSMIAKILQAEVKSFICRFNLTLFRNLKFRSFTRIFNLSQPYETIYSNFGQELFWRISLFFNNCQNLTFWKLLTLADLEIFCNS